MKFFAFSLIASLTAASAIIVARVPAPEAAEAQSVDDVFLRQRDTAGSTTKNELEDGVTGQCPQVILIFARGTSEAGNLGPIAGVPLAGALEAKYGEANVWVQGVGRPYTAGLVENLLPGGTSQDSINEGIRLFNEANTKCPNTPVVTGGYSQGSALIAGAIARLQGTVRNQVKGVVLFGYTQDKQNNGGIPNYPAANLKVFCATGDLVCDGTLFITLFHFLYAPDARGPAAQFLENILAGN